MQAPSSNSRSENSRPENGQTASRDHPSSGSAQPSQRPAPTTLQGAVDPTSSSQAPKKRKNRGGKKRRNRQRSFATAPSVTSAITDNMDQIGEDHDDDHDGHHDTPSAIRPGENFYKRRRNPSHDSLDSDALFDHRHQTPMRPRRESRLNITAVQRAGQNASMSRQRTTDSPRHHQHLHAHASDVSDQDDPNEQTPLMPIPRQQHRSPHPGVFRSNTRGSSRSSGARRRTKSSNTGQSVPKSSDGIYYDVNNPPSVPGSPHMQASLDDPMMPDTDFLKRSPNSSRNIHGMERAYSSGDVLIDVDGEDQIDEEPNSAPPSPRIQPDGMKRGRRAMTFDANEDVCMPLDMMSEMAYDDFQRMGYRDETRSSQPRRRRKEWPVLSILEQWSVHEKEMRAADTQRMQRVQEPVLVDGRLRAPRTSAWHREEAPNRFTYFNVEFESTIHAPTISELVPPGGDFRELFIPEPPLIEESDSSESEVDVPADSSAIKDDATTTGETSPKFPPDANGDALSRLNTAPSEDPRSPPQGASRLGSMLSEQVRGLSRDASGHRSADRSGDRTPQNKHVHRNKPQKYGERPQFWLDVLAPTHEELNVMKVAFSIHPLTIEDIREQEAREKVELFKNYYFISYQTFEQDPASEDYLEPVNVYILVFRHGIITFHHSQIPHPNNVRRRIRQLQNTLELTADWISYAIIDDITDVFQPLIGNIEKEVDDIDEAILQSTPGAAPTEDDKKKEEEVKEKDGRSRDDKSDTSSLFSLPKFLKDSGQKRDTSGYDMLRRVGETRKRVMSLYRLLGSKADVIKGFAKRCNEQWSMTPKNEIGLYLGDIQDHILTMTSNLSHYETLLSRAHSNYLAQVSIRMNERSEQTGDILNKLTVFGTIVLPMNIICGMWGMNVKVPGQDIDNLWWFGGITAGLMAFALSCYLLCRKLYGIV